MRRAADRQVVQKSDRIQDVVWWWMSGDKNCSVGSYLLSECLKQGGGVRGVNGYESKSIIAVQNFCADESPGTRCFLVRVFLVTKIM